MPKKMWYPNQVQSKISDETNENLIKVSLAKKQSVSATIREILEDYLK